MTGSVLAQLTRLGRWPRRIAALACLALAAVSVLSAQRPKAADASTHSDRSSGIASGLRPGQLAVPVTLHDGSAAQYVHVGDRIDLYAGPPEGAVAPAGPAELAAGKLLVIAVLAPAGGAQASEQTRVIVAADRSSAAKVAALDGRDVLAVLDKYP